MVHYQGDDSFPMTQRRIIAGLCVIGIIGILMIATLEPSVYHIEQDKPEKHVYFKLASWDYPDEYGQGIYMLKFYENSTASWVAAPWYYVGGELDGLPFYSLHYYDPYTLNWSVGVAMKIRVYSLFNQTLVGVGSTAEGQNYLRHDVTVTTPSSTVFEQQNFTYYDVTENGNYYYEYEVVLDFIPASGQIYTVLLTYEIYF